MANFDSLTKSVVEVERYDGYWDFWVLYPDDSSHQAGSAILTDDQARELAHAILDDPGIRP
jgi:hypothetical protein